MNARSLSAIAKRALASRWGWQTAGTVGRAPGVIVLTYHRVQDRERSHIGISAERFASQMRWVRRHCDPIHPDEVQERARLDRRRRRPAVLVTFDDGYRDYHDLAYPVLKELAIPALVFVTTSFVGADHAPWTEELQWAVNHSREESVKLPWSRGAAVRLGDGVSRAALGEHAREHLKTLPDADRRSALTALLGQLGPSPRRERQMLTWDEVRRTMDVTTYGGHSHTHPVLSRLSREDCEREICLCRERIVAETAREPRYFAYPNGQPADYNTETQELLRHHGFTVAFSGSEGIAGPDTDWMAVKRIPGLNATPADLAWYVVTRSWGTWSTALRRASGRQREPSPSD